MVISTKRLSRRIGYYSWAGPNTIDMLKTKYFSPKLSLNSIMNSYDYEYLAELKDKFGVTDFWCTYSWGFANGLETNISAGSENISLGQKQLIAFLRVLLREPKLLILDEATANIDTVTEQLLEDILKKLPDSVTKVIIAHRLNTIKNADQIFFISGGDVEKPLDFKSALNLLNTAKVSS